jgi:hypothetical protein
LQLIAFPNLQSIVGLPGKLEKSNSSHIELPFALVAASYDSSEDNKLWRFKSFR